MAQGMELTVWKDELTDQGTTKHYPLGTVRRLADGSEWVYIKVGGANLSPGIVCSTALNAPATEDTPDKAETAGDTRVVLTQASVSADDYADGYLYVDAGTAVGECYKIKSNTASGTAGSGNQFYADLYDPLKTDWSAAGGDTDLSYHKSPYNAVVKQVSNTQLAPVCVTQWALTSANYGWALKRGFGAVLVDVASAAGAEVDERILMCSEVTDGYAGITTTAATYAGAYKIGFLIEDADLTDAIPHLAYIDISP